MNPPARPWKTELNEAVVGGIRQRGPEAFGALLVALMRIVIALLVLGLQLLASWLLDYDVTAWPFVGMLVISGLVSWLTMRAHEHEQEDRDESD